MLPLGRPELPARTPGSLEKKPIKDSTETRPMHKANSKDEIDKTLLIRRKEVDFDRLYNRKPAAQAPQSTRPVPPVPQPTVNIPKLNSAPKLSMRKVPSIPRLTTGVMPLTPSAVQGLSEVQSRKAEDPLTRVHTSNPVFVADKTSLLELNFTADDYSESNSFLLDSAGTKDLPPLDFPHGSINVLQASGKDKASNITQPINRIIAGKSVSVFKPISKSSSVETINELHKAELDTLRLQVQEVRNQRDGFESNCAHLQEQLKKLESDSCAVQSQLESKIEKLEITNTELRQKLADSLQEQVTLQKRLEQAGGDGTWSGSSAFLSNLSDSPLSSNRTARIDKLLHKLKSTTRDLGSLAANAEQTSSAFVTPSKKFVSEASILSSPVSPTRDASVHESPSSLIRKDSQNSLFDESSKESLRATLKKRNSQPKLHSKSSSSSNLEFVITKKDSGTELESPSELLAARDDWSNSLINIIGSMGI